MARALADGAVKIADFDPARIAEPAMRQLMQRTSVRLDRELDARVPRQLPSRVRLMLNDGRTVEETILDAKGDPEAPLSHAELTAKFLDLIADSPYAARGPELVAAVTGLATRPDARGLLSLPA